MNIVTVSKILTQLVMLPIIALPALLIYFLFNIPDFQFVAQSNLNVTIQWNTVEDGQWYVTILISMLPSMLLVWGLIHLRKVFVSFSKEEFFIKDNIYSIKRFSFSLMLSSILQLCSLAAVSVILSLNHPAGQKILAVQVESQHFFIFFIGLVFWVIAKILTIARQTHIENQSFV
jgi:hypothetical protein